MDQVRSRYRKPSTSLLALLRLPSGTLLGRVLTLVLPSHRRRARPSLASEQLGTLTNTGGPSSLAKMFPPPASRHRRPEPSPLPRSSVDPVPKPEPTSASRTEPRAHQFPSTGTTGWEADPRADDLFHEPETHPNPTHTRTHPATVATTQTPPGCHPRDTAW